MHLVEFPLLASTFISHCIVGNFSGTKSQQEILVIRGTSQLEILKPDSQTGKLTSLIKKNLFGDVRSLQSFRLLGANKDFIIIGSDSGRISIVEYVQEKHSLESVAIETFGRSGCRRTVPGQFLAVDPKGRAVIISSIEKSKFAYILNRDASSKLMISSPLDCHKSHTMVHQLTALDVGYENPIFVSLESFLQVPGQDTLPEAEKMLLVQYELDLGLNHMVRKNQIPIDRTSHFLMPLPNTSPGSSGSDGPGGVLVFSLGQLSWFSEDLTIDPFTLTFPMNNLLISCAFLHKTKSSFFILFQLESGDLFKLVLEYYDGRVTQMEVAYFDTINPCRSICILRTGFLITASDQGNNVTYQIIGLAENEEQKWDSNHSKINLQTQLFRRSVLKNLLKLEEEFSLSLITDTKIQYVPGEESPRIITVGGTGLNSYLVALRHGIEVSELAVTELPLGNPTGIWTLGKATLENNSSGYSAFGPTRYIIVSFASCTTALLVDESVEEDTESPFSLSHLSTIYLAPMIDGSVIQVTQKSLRHIRADGSHGQEWTPLSSSYILKATSNSTQVIISTNECEIILFNLDTFGKIVENKNHCQLENQIASIALPGSPWTSSTLVSHLPIVCICTEGDQVIRLFALGSKGFELIALQAIQQGLVFSLAFTVENDPSASDKFGLFLYAGLSNGILVRFTIEGNLIAGLSLSDPRIRFIGPSSLNLVVLPSLQDPLNVNMASLLLLSTKPWIQLGSSIGDVIPSILPINYLNISFAAIFSSSDSGLGLLGVSGSTLRIISFDKSTCGTEITGPPPILQPYLTISLPATPRRLTIIDNSIFSSVAVPNSLALVLCSEPHNNVIFRDNHSLQHSLENGSIDETSTEFQSVNKIYSNDDVITHVWNSFIEIYDIVTGIQKFSFKLPSNESILCGSLIRFHGHAQLYFVLGTGVNVSQMPLSFESAWLSVYEWNLNTPSENAEQIVNLQLIHKTQVEELPASFCAFRGRLLVGLGSTLRLYDLGKKKLLRKSENRSFPSRIYSISSPGTSSFQFNSTEMLSNINATRVVVCDVQHSLCIAIYKPEDNCFYLIADDPIPRWPSCAHLPLDYDTSAVADKFGGLSILRLPFAISEAIDSDISGARLLDRSHLLGAPNKIENICHAHIGDTITSLNKTLLVWSSGREVLLYTTITGSIGAMIPLLAREDVNFFQKLEMHLRAAITSLLGREHLSYRSSFSPAKHIIDGALLVQFHTLSSDKKAIISADLEMTPMQISKKIEEIKILYAL